MGSVLRVVLRAFVVMGFLGLAGAATAKAFMGGSVTLGPDITVDVGQEVSFTAIFENPDELVPRFVWSSDGPPLTISGLFSDAAGFTVARDMAGRSFTITVRVDYYAREAEAGDEPLYSRTDSVLVSVNALPGPGPDEVVATFQGARINSLMAEQPDLAPVFDSVGGPGIVVSSMGEALAVSVGGRGPVWAELRGNRSVLEGASGAYALGSVGAHWQTSEGVVLGLMAMADRMETDSVTGTGWLAGPYAVFRAAGQPLVFQARYLVGDSRNRLADGTTFGSRRSLAMIGVSGSVTRGAVEIVPSLRAAHGREVSDAFVIGKGLVVPAQVTAMTQVETGLAVAFPVDLGSGETRLRMGIADIWTDGSAALDGHRAEVSVLLRHRLAAAGGELTLQLSRDGLGMPGFKATRVAVNYALAF